MPTTHHTQGTAACQQPPVLAADKRLILRYGAAALADGYAAIPRVVIRHRHALGITASEWDYLCELWSYWHSTAGPCPAVETLARGLGVDQSTIRRHRASLEQKGLLRVTLDGAHNRYDLSPLIAAAVGLDRLQQEQRATAAGPCIVAAQERAELHAEQEVEKTIDLDSMPPTPTTKHDADPPPHACRGRFRIGTACRDKDWRHEGAEDAWRGALYPWWEPVLASLPGTIERPPLYHRKPAKCINRKPALTMPTGTLLDKTAVIAT